MSPGALPEAPYAVRGAAPSVEHQLRLDAYPGAVPRARRFVADVLTRTGCDVGAGAAELVVTELVTNALLHAGGPLALRVVVAPGSVRLAVSDGSTRVPVRPTGDPDGMTGRGLGLIDAVASRWGVRAADGGKVIWAEIGFAGDRRDGAGDPVDGLVPTGLDAEPADSLVVRGPRHEIVLGDVPTDLLLAAKAHVDNVLRELTLASTGAESGQSAAVSPRLASIVAAITTGFTEARDAIKQQAQAAAEAGQPRTRLVLHLPVSAAGAGRAYLRALEDADVHARASRLLVLEESPQHQSFRRWYVSGVISQLEAIGRGDEPPAQPTLEEHLLAELGIVAEARRRADRSARLQAATASLAAAADLGDVARTVVSEGLSALDASRGLLLLSVGSSHLTVAGGEAYDGRPLAQLPSAQVLRTGAAVWLETRPECEATFPELMAVESSTCALCAVPLRTGGRLVGALRLSFDTPRLFADEERDFVLAMAALAAQALERGQLYAAGRNSRQRAEVAAHRLSRLHRVTVQLAAASDVESITDAVCTEASRSLGASLSALCLVDPDGDTMRVAGLSGGEPGALQRWSTFPIALDVPASEAVRTNRAVVLRSQREAVERYPALAAEPGLDQTLVCVPLSAGERRLGSLVLRFPLDHSVDEPELDLLTTIATQCVLALDRVSALVAERAARRDAAYLDEASALLSSSLERRHVLTHLVQLVVPRMADWSVVYLRDDQGRVEAATAAHREPALTQQLVGPQRERWLDGDLHGDLHGDLGAESTIGQVLGTGRSVRHAVVPPPVRDRVTAGPELAEHSAALVPSTALTVPLVARDKVIGALALARVAGAAYTTHDAALVEQLAARGAVAIENAERFRRERDTALTLQHSLLPQELPRVPGVRLAWRYLPGGVGTYVGGDWYDAVPLDDGRVALVIGDVMGHGVRAAAVMGQLRAMARAQLAVEVSPRQVLGRLDHALTRLGQEQIATALLGLLDPAERTLTLASAGHLPPLLSAGDGSAAFVHVETGPPLGVGTGPFPERRLQLPPRSTVLLYTDGLVEDKQLPIDEGMRLLAEVGRVAEGPEQLCQLALTALGRGRGADDDTALLAVGLH